MMAIALRGWLPKVVRAAQPWMSVIDVAARKEIGQIKVGQVPKRNITARIAS